MYLYFYKDGTYSNELLEDRVFQFGCVDISTKRKGPAFAFVDHTEWKKIPEYTMRMIMHYGSADVPADSETAFETVIENNPMQGMYSAYNSYPLLKQLIYCNSFIDGTSQFTDNHIFIEEIQFDMKKKGSYVINESTSDKELHTFFEKFGILTTMSDVVSQGECILLNRRGYWKKYKFEEGFDLADYMTRMHWDSAFLCLPEMETAYYLRSGLINLLQSINELSVTLTYSVPPEDYSLSYFENLDNKYENTYTANNLYDILRMCLYVPQILYIEQSIYKMDATLTIKVVRDTQNVELKVTRKETREEDNTCIYHLLEKLLMLIRSTNKDNREGRVW